jgi:hypothetical protein
MVQIENNQLDTQIVTMIAIQRLLLLLFFTAFIFGANAQNAALYSFDFQVPEKYRRGIQLYDNGGNKKYKKDLYSDKMILDKAVETLSKKEVNTICRMAAEMLKHKFGYADVRIMYPLNGNAGFNRLKDFPNLRLKKAMKKLTADAYIALEMHILEKEPFIQGSDILEILNIPDDERIMFFDFSAKYIIYSAKKAIIDQGQITLSDIEDELNRHFANYNKKVDEKGRYKLWKPYFTKEDIKSIYKIAEQKLEEAE